MKQSLTDLVYELHELYREVEENDGEINEALEREFKLTEDSIERKISAMMIFRRNLEDQIVSSKELRKDLMNNEKRLERDIARLDDYLLYSVGPQYKAELPVGKLSFTKSTRVSCVDEALVPECYKKNKLVTTVNIAQAKKDIKSGAAVPPGLEYTEHHNLKLYQGKKDGNDS